MPPDFMPEHSSDPNLAKEEPPLAETRFTSFEMLPAEEREEMALNEQLLGLCADIHGLHQQWEGKRMTPQVLQTFFQKYIGKEYTLPLHTLPSLEDMLHACVDHQCEHASHKTHIGPPLPPVPSPQDLVEKSALLRAQFAYLMDRIHDVAKQEGHNICWEHIAWLDTAASSVQLGRSLAVQRPNREICTVLCMRFVHSFQTALEATKPPAS
jgi:hypothetical protein